MDYQDCMLMLTVLAKGVPKWAPDFSDSMTMEVWWDVLKDIDPLVLRNTCKLIVQNEAEFPAISKFLRLAKGSSLTDEQHAQNITARIEAAIGTHGYTNRGAAGDAIGEFGRAVVDELGGWVPLCLSMDSNDELPSFRKRCRDTALILLKEWAMLEHREKLKEIASNNNQALIGEK